ncbi:MAG: glycoside hydrolase family 38 C-terminal domain-containing protein [Eubacteriales bacterium]
MKIHIVSHTHWDREWYRPFQYFNVRLSYFFDNLFDIIENDEEYKCFMLDGQMVMIEDYLNLKPQNKEKIKKLTQQGRLIIGPWYSQPDEFAPDGESLIRNLLIGTNMAKEYGNYMRVGYLPDSFGQSAQMPHILKGSGIDKACMMRGVPADRIEGTEFNWIGLNGDRVFASALVTGYSNGMFLPENNLSIDMRMKKIIHNLKKAGSKNNLLVLNGVDHQFAQPQIAKYIKSKGKDKYVHTTLEKYLECAKKESGDIVEIEGELISPVTNRVHTSIASSRMYQKTKNRTMEALLEKSVEPICTLSWMYGAEYPTEIINSAWKKMFMNQAHDSICGCCTDEVHKEIDQRFADIDNIGSTIYKMHSRAISAVSAGDRLSLVVYNNSMIKGIHHVNATIFVEKKNFKLIDENGNEIEYSIYKSEEFDAATMSIWSLYLDTPCIVQKAEISFDLEFDFNYGYKKIKIVEGEKPSIETKGKISETREIENKFSKIMINSNGTFNLFDKQSNREYKNLNLLEDCGDEGDTYNYSPVKNDKVFTNENTDGCEIQVEEYANKTIAILKYEMQVPEGLTDDWQGRSKKMVSQKIETKITLYKNIKRIDIRTKIENKAKDHRIRVIFPTGISSKYSYAETQFGIIKRCNRIEDAENWEEKKWHEKPLPIYSNQKFVDINDGNVGLAVLNRGLTEYEIYTEKDHAIAVTLVRGVGYMGKADLAVRPGRPSGVNLATPDAQCIGEIVSEYSIFAHAGTVDEAQVAKHAAAYNCPPDAVQSSIRLSAIEKKFGHMINLFDVQRLQNRVEDRLSEMAKSDYGMIDIDNENIIIAAIKKAENEEAIILRVYNSIAENAESAVININCKFEKAYICDFMENDIEEVETDGQIIRTGIIRGYTAQTYKIIL